MKTVLKIKEKKNVLSQNKANIKSAIIQFRIDPKIKAKAVSIFDKANIDLSFAMQAFLEEVVEKGVSPVEVRTVNGFLPSFEKKLIAKYKKEKFSEGYDNVKDFMLALNK